MQRAIAHLLDNAVRFAPTETVVTITARAVGGDIVIAVADRGPGLSEETLANLYDRTWHSKRAERVGAGLGLAIVRGFVEAHNGRILVDASADGTTPTTFSLVLPKDVPVSGPDVDAAAHG